MRPLSATEAISPAIEHAKALMSPFSLRLWLKLGLVAVFAEMGGQFLFPPVGNLPQSGSKFASSTGGMTPMVVTILVIAALVGFVVGLALLYLGSRLQLVLIDLVATRTTLVAPAWHRTAPRTWRWIGVKVVCFFVVFAIVGAIAVGPILYFVHAMPAGNAQPTGAFFGAFALFFVALFFVIFVLMVAIWALRDFVLPFILFEDASFGDSLSRASGIFRNEPGPVLFYLFMKFVLSIVAGIVGELCILLGVLVAAIPTGIVAAILWFALHNSGPFGTIVMYISFGLLGAFFLTVFFALAFCIGGAVLIFYQAYALYFIGGRIPEIGNLLQPEPPPYFPPIPAPPMAPA
jgi:hypothetical protein